MIYPKSMSDHYFKCARDKGCVGIKKDMRGFHACAIAADCKKKKNTKKKRNVEGSGYRNPWLVHVQEYREKHKCSYKDALKGASKTYR
jgi:hypothetical protein